MKLKLPELSQVFFVFKKDFEWELCCFCLTDILLLYIELEMIPVVEIEMRPLYEFKMSLRVAVAVTASEVHRCLNSCQWLRSSSSARFQ